MAKINEKLLRFVLSRDFFHVDELNPYHPRGIGVNLLEGLRNRKLIKSLGNYRYKVIHPKGETIEGYIKRITEERRGKATEASHRSSWRWDILSRR